MLLSTRLFVFIQTLQFPFKTVNLFKLLFILSFATWGKTNFRIANNFIYLLNYDYGFDLMGGFFAVVITGFWFFCYCGDVEDFFINASS